MSDSVLLAITSICEAIKAIFTFLCTVQGQAQVQEWREDRAKMKADFATFATGWHAFWSKALWSKMFPDLYNK